MEVLSISLGIFETTMNSIFQKPAPVKKEYVRANKASFTNNKITTKELMFGVQNQC